MKPLTPRELRLCELLACGLSNKEIGWHMRITNGTVKEYINRIMKKGPFDSRLAIALWWITEQVLADPLAWADKQSGRAA